jgi:hypothetical protein
MIDPRAFITSGRLCSAREYPGGECNDGLVRVYLTFRLTTTSNSVTTASVARVTIASEW